MTSEVIITRPVWEEYRRIKPRLRNQALAALIDYLMTGEKPAFSRNINTPFNQLLVTYKESTETLHSSRTHLALISHSSQEEEKQKKASSPCTPILKEEEKEEERLILPTSELAARDTAETAIEVVEEPVGQIGPVRQVGPVRDPNKRLMGEVEGAPSPLPPSTKFAATWQLRVIASTPSPSSATMNRTAGSWDAQK